MAWTGEGLSQQQLMLKDECILVDHNDKIIGNANKYTSHQFTESNPRGQLHRAFSVFLFDDQGRLLLQQRAPSKITFPNVWTNTCCSHPLTGFEPSEIDDDESIANGTVAGAKAAAIRKLGHELGISSKEVPEASFKFLTRLHYWAADVVTHGPDSTWGEHEIDYILFIQANVTLALNDEEVCGAKYVTLSELQSMMNPASGLLWSPWFRIIAEKFLVHWWADLNATLNTNTFVDAQTIYRFDPSSEHMGGAGKAGSYLGTACYNGSRVTSSCASSAAALATVSPAPVLKPKKTQGPGNNAALKQGAYGKVKIHKHSKIDQIMRFDEIFAMVWYKVGAQMPNKVDLNNADVKFCDDMLGKVSRSFAAVIRQLPKGLCIDILIFYLALRALDTIEDDMEAFVGIEHVKLDHLNNFYRTGLVTPGWSMDGVGEADERVLLQQYNRCVTVFLTLSAASQAVIADITKRMGQGMAAFSNKELTQGTVTVKDYDLYCHYVAGLVGEGLSRLFTCTGYELPAVEQVATTKANTMGLFLQKTNILRDYLEDYVDGRAFWPQEVWKKYSSTNDLGEFALPENIDRAIHCLNDLVTNALECVPECLEYMDLLKTEEVFRFCAIPQVMAIATLAELHNNPKVFTGVVKIRKGLAVKLILDTKSVGGLHKWFNVLTRQILQQVKSSDPSAARTRAICKEILRLTDKQAAMAINGGYAQVVSAIAPVTFAMAGRHLFGQSSLQGGRFTFAMRPIVTSLDMVSLAVLAGSALFVLGYSVVASGRPQLRRADP